MRTSEPELSEAAYTQFLSKMAEESIPSKQKLLCELRRLSAAAFRRERSLPSPGELAELIGLSHSATCGLLRDLQAAGDAVVVGGKSGKGGGRKILWAATKLE